MDNGSKGGCKQRKGREGLRRNRFLSFLLSLPGHFQQELMDPSSCTTIRYLQLKDIRVHTTFSRRWTGHLSNWEWFGTQSEERKSEWDHKDSKQERKLVMAERDEGREERREEERERQVKERAFQLVSTPTSFSLLQLHQLFDTFLTDSTHNNCYYNCISMGRERKSHLQGVREYCKREKVREREREREN